MRIIILALLLLGACTSNKQKSLTDKKADILYQHGTQKLVDKDYTGALKKLLNAQQLRPNDEKILNNLGMAYFFKNELEQAKSYYSRALEVNPKFSEARNNLASIYFYEKKYSNAKEHYLIVAKDLVYDQQFRTHYNLALIYNQEKDLNMTMKALETSIAINDSYCPSHYLRGKIFYKSRKYKEALKSFHKATLGACFQSPAPHFFKAKTYLKMKMYENADAILTELIQNHPNTRFHKEADKLKIKIAKYSSKHSKSINEAISQFNNEQKKGEIQTPKF